MKKDEYLKPQKIVGNEGEAWYYVMKNRVDVVHEIRDQNGNYLRTVTLKIPLGRINVLAGQQK